MTRNQTLFRRRMLNMRKSPFTQAPASRPRRPIRRRPPSASSRLLKTFGMPAMPRRAPRATGRVARKRRSPPNSSSGCACRSRRVPGSAQAVLPQACERSRDSQRPAASARRPPPRRSGHCHSGPPPLNRGDGRRPAHLGALHAPHAGAGCPRRALGRDRTRRRPALRRARRGQRARGQLAAVAEGLRAVGELRRGGVRGDRTPQGRLQRACGETELSPTPRRPCSSSCAATPSRWCAPSACRRAPRWTRSTARLKDLRRQLAELTDKERRARHTHGDRGRG